MEKEQRKLMLHYWYVELCKDEWDGTEFLWARGVVSGHHKIQDSRRIHTSYIRKMEINDELEEMVIYTKNSIYHCPLEYCNFDKQDNYADLIPNYERIREQHYGKRINPSIEEGNVLLVLSNFDYYYFNSLYYKPKGENEPLTYESYAHIGMFLDSFLISIEKANIDLRYFPHYGNIEFYSQEVNDIPFYIENSGDTTLYVKSFDKVFRLEPGERKEIKDENAEKEYPILFEGDLYPAKFIKLEREYMEKEGDI